MDKSFERYGRNEKENEFERSHRDSRSRITIRWTDEWEDVFGTIYM